MSNTICIRTNKSSTYRPFRWENELLYAYIGKQWVRVEKTGKVNQYKDAIFTVIMPIELFIPKG